MKNLPKRIYLQVDPDNENPEDFSDLSGVTWCTERVNKSDIEYQLSDKIFLKKYCPLCEKVTTHRIIHACMGCDNY